jgi:hypothetical protein
MILKQTISTKRQLETRIYNPDLFGVHFSTSLHFQQSGEAISETSIQNTVIDK